MKKIFISLVLFPAVIMLTGCDNEISTDRTGNTGGGQPVADNQPMPYAVEPADRLEVYYFHRTARCYSCKTIGAYVRETMEQKYAGEISAGIIDFRELNAEEPENKEIVRKFRATGSSLFINRIIDGRDNIEQDMNVWRLLGDEQRFKSYLEDKINSYLGIQDHGVYQPIDRQL